MVETENNNYRFDTNWEEWLWRTRKLTFPGIGIVNMASFMNTTDFSYIDKWKDIQERNKSKINA